MSPDGGGRSPRWADATAAAAIFATDPLRVAGISLRAAAGPTRDAWQALVARLLTSRVLRVPLHISDNRLLGGLDLAATLSAGRPVVEHGVLASADGGVVVLAMAERLTAATAARIVNVLDTGEVAIERDGFALRAATRFGVIALDEGIEPEERPPAMLLDRLAIHLELTGVAPEQILDFPLEPAQIATARQQLARVRADERVIEALCEAATALGIRSVRAPLLALHVARAAAALEGQNVIGDEHLALAARLVLAPRATTLPQDAEQPDQPDQPEQHNSAPESSPNENEAPQNEKSQNDKQDSLSDVVLDAAESAIPRDLLAQLQSGVRRGACSRQTGRTGAKQASRLRGRPTGVTRGDLGRGARLNVIETLRAAAPWQRIREARKRIEVRREDFRITRFKHVTRTTTVFAVDASGSAALHRLAEVKGAVELLLADCYVRRDSVALIAFRKQMAELLLPPTRSLLRAKRSLASLPAGGATPLASGLDAALALAESVLRRGDVPVIVLITDGRANIGRGGSGGGHGVNGEPRAPGRDIAEADALNAARALRAARVTTLLIDSAPQPRPFAARLAHEMGARYLPLPHANARALSDAVRTSISDESARA